jgi:ribosomal protein L21
MNCENCAWSAQCNEKKKQGHRQPYTKVQITKIDL